MVTQQKGARLADLAGTIKLPPEERACGKQLRRVCHGAVQACLETLAVELEMPAVFAEFTKAEAGFHRVQYLVAVTQQ